LSHEVQHDQRAAYAEMRHRCPVAYSDFMGWSLFRHEDVMRVLLDHETFSSAVSQHLSVPSGMDQPEHTANRRIIDALLFSNTDGSIRTELSRDRDETGAGRECESGS
jgi:cytochrome P450